MSRAQRGESNFLADRGIASPPAAARNVTVENFLPQQRWQWGGWLLSFSEFPEGKIHYQMGRASQFWELPHASAGKRWGLLL